MSRASQGNLPDARATALKWLSRRDYSRLELELKLARKLFSAQTVAAELDRLEEEGYLSDRRFAEMLVRSRVSGGYGPVKIRHELRQKGVASAICEQLLAELAQDWAALATQVQKSHFGASPPGDFRAKSKRARYLQARGFEHDHIRAAVGLSETD